MNLSVHLTTSWNHYEPTTSRPATQIPHLLTLHREDSPIPHPPVRASFALLPLGHAPVHPTHHRPPPTLRRNLVRSLSLHRTFSQARSQKRHPQHYCWRHGSQRRSRRSETARRDRPPALDLRASPPTSRTHHRRHRHLALQRLQSSSHWRRRRRSDHNSWGRNFAEGEGNRHHNLPPTRHDPDPTDAAALATEVHTNSARRNRTRKGSCGGEGTQGRCGGFRTVSGRRVWRLIKGYTVEERQHRVVRELSEFRRKNTMSSHGYEWTC